MSFSVGSVVSHFDSFSLGLKIYKSVCVLFFFFLCGPFNSSHFFQFLHTRKGYDSSVWMWMLESRTDTEKGLR